MIPKPRKARDARYARSLKGRFRNGLARAKKIGVSWTLAFTEYTHFVSHPCDYCQGPLDETGSGLDRIDSKLGYEYSNVVPCCGQCNRLKGCDLSASDMRTIRKIMRFVKEEL